MTGIEMQIDRLAARLQDLQNRQVHMTEEMANLQAELQLLQSMVQSNQVVDEGNVEQAVPLPTGPTQPDPYILQARKNVQQKKPAKQKNAFHLNQEMEDFIGTNVISKVGILVTIIGVFIGAKYAIDNELVSPLVRIIAGYLTGAALVAVAYKLKSKYQYFSSILIGGGLAVTYFITYIAYSFYALFPLSVAFLLMVLTTAATVAIALWYNQKIIAIIGQVAAYAIPFLLGNGNGNIFVLFSYITVINVGLVFLSFTKQWKILYHLGFFLTWFIYFVSIVLAGKAVDHFSATMLFLVISFVTFYVTFLAYKILKKELYQVGEIGILLLNALFFFFLGTYIVHDSFNNIHVLTCFTIANAAVHLVVGYAIYKLRLVDQSVFQFILGLGLLFITIAVPIELDGNWVTFLWTVEATVLCYVGYKSERVLYFEIALPLIIVSAISLLIDWDANYPFVHGFDGAGNYRKTPFLNVNFGMSLLVSTGFGYMSMLSRNSNVKRRFFGFDFYKIMLPVAFLAILYLTIFNEIHFAWDQVIFINHDKAAPFFRSISLMIFSSLYIAAWIFLNNHRIKSTRFHYLLLALALLINLSFLFNALYNFGQLRDVYISNASTSSFSLLTIRYLCIGALAILWVSIKNAFVYFKPDNFLLRASSTVFNTILLATIANEFIHWMDLAGYQNQYKLGLSLICGSYALVLLFIGIMNKKKHLRMSAMVLFAATLIKLFFYDLVSLSTISKTVVLVLLGVLLLLASFLYNKYKDLLFVKEETGKDQL